MTLVAHYPLQEDSGSTAYDFAGSNDGTVNGATQGATGLLGTSAYDFDGTQNGVEAPSVGTLDPISVSLWLNPNANLDGGSTNNWSLASEGGEWGFQNNSGKNDGSKFAFGVYGDRLRTNKSTWSAGTWYYLVVVFDSANNNWKIYVDGKEDANKNPSTSITSASGKFYLARNSSNDLKLNGTLADVRIYDRALSPTSIQYLYQSGVTRGSLVTAAQQL